MCDLRISFPKHRPIVPHHPRRSGSRPRTMRYTHLPMWLTTKICQPHDDAAEDSQPWFNERTGLGRIVRNRSVERAGDESQPRHADCCSPEELQFGHARPRRGFRNACRMSRHQRRRKEFHRCQLTAVSGGVRWSTPDDDECRPSENDTRNRRRQTDAATNSRTDHGRHCRDHPLGSAAWRSPSVGRILNSPTFGQLLSQCDPR